MIKIGSSDISSIPGVSRVYIGSTHIWGDYPIPSGYRQLTGVTFNGQVWYETDYKLTGADTLSFAFSASVACNILGCYGNTSSQNNYSLYVNNSGTAAYLRYNGGSYNSRVVFGDRYDVVITPTGSSGMYSDSTWTAKTFEADAYMCIGTTSLSATSAKLTGNLYGNVVVSGKANFVPVEKSSTGDIQYFNTFSGNLFSNLGSGTPVALGYV